jgi:cAMP-dependent protein kinase regulator
MDHLVLQKGISPCLSAIFIPVLKADLPMSTFDTLVEDLTRDVHRVQPKDALQFCANWFQSRLEEQRTRTRDSLSQRSSSFSRDLPSDLYIDTPLSAGAGPMSISPFSQAVPSRPRSSLSVSPSPFGTLNIPGNALLSYDHDPNNTGPPSFAVEGRELLPTSPLTIDHSNSYTGFDGTPTSIATSLNPGDYLHPPTSTIFARRTSVSAESIAVDSSTDEPLPVYPKTPDQLRRIKVSIANNFIFRDLDEEQGTGVLNAMQERMVGKDEVVIRQGDVGEYFYVVESGFLHCYIRPEPLPPTWLTDTQSSHNGQLPEKFLQPGYHPEFGRKVAECKPGNSFGELALMYGHPRAATVFAIEPSTLWSLDRITFRTIILKAAHRRRTMYEGFLSSVDLLSSLQAEERSKIADALVSKVYVDGEAVVKQGEMGDTFFFVEEGEASVTKLQSDGSEVQAGILKKGNYFGGTLKYLTLFYLSV